MGIEYDTSEGIIGAAAKVGGTVIPEVLAAYEFWFLLLFNIIVRYARASELINPEIYNVDLPWHLTGVTGSLMTFFVCFYNGQQFSRYNHVYEVTQKMFEHTLEFASMVRVQVADKAVQRKAVKLVVASCFTFLSFQRTGWLSAKQWRLFYKLELLSSEEIDVLRRHIRHLEEDAMPSFLPLQWAGELIHSVTENPEDREDMLAGFFVKIYSLRSCQAEMVATMELPMPFQYFHIMNMMLALNLLLWAYALACQDSYFAPIIFAFSQMMFQGLRELSTSLSNPWGEDDVDFPVEDWMQRVYSRVYGLIEDTFDIKKLNDTGPLIHPKDFQLS
eukprot:TRINITY_DN45612_c0_g1_i1.p1 TRINITY_DN45612_c0_g1~~TRINITY_DN45612_c0_g1_i1.p1  ORF type:complete len:332 (+),score=69.91 TRINITY_DN45612_c0_g1_i1:181-1176(+)